MGIIDDYMTIIDHNVPPRRSGSEPSFFALHVAEARRFYLDLEPEEGARLQVVSGGCEHSAPGYEIQRDDLYRLRLQT